MKTNEQTEIGLLSPTRSSPTAFWRTGPGIVIRWIAFLPLGIFGPAVISFLCLMMLYWLSSGSVKEFVILCLIGAPLVLLSITAAVAAYFVAYVAMADVCPIPKAGVVIYAAILAILVFRWVVMLCGNWPGLGIFLFQAIHFGLLVGATNNAAKQAYR